MVEGYSQVIRLGAATIFREIEMVKERRGRKGRGEGEKGEKEDRTFVSKKG